MEPDRASVNHSSIPGRYILIGITLYALVIFFTYRLFTLHDQDAGLDRAVLTALGAIAVPLIAIGLALTLPQFFSLGPRNDGSCHFQLGWIILIPAYALHLTLRGYFELFSWWALIMVSMAGGLILACFISRLRAGLLHFVAILGFASGYVGGAVLFINCVFDSRLVEVTAQRIPDARISPAAFTVKFKHARPFGRAQLRVNSSQFEGIHDGVCVRVYRGVLLLPWYTVDPYLDCPGTKPPIHDLAHRQAQLCAAGHEPSCKARAKSPAGTYPGAQLENASAEKACFKGDRKQCDLLCAQGKKYLGCPGQEWRITGKDWTVHYWTSGSGPDGRYKANLAINCTEPLEASVKPASKPVDHLVEYDGEQFRGPVSRRMHHTLAGAVREVCFSTPAPVPDVELPDHAQMRPSANESPLKARSTLPATSVYKCRSPGGKIILTDTACDKAGE